MTRWHADNVNEFVLSEVDEQFARAPYDTYRVLRDHAPFCWQPDGSVVVTRYDDVKAILSDSKRFSSDKRVDFHPKFGDTPLYEHHTTSLVFNDPPYHTRVRKLLGPFFAARTLRQMEGNIAAMVDRLLDAAATHDQVDMVSDFALQIPLNLIGELLGVPEDEREPLQAWAKVILGGLEPVRTLEQLDEGNQAVEDFKDYLRQLIHSKRANPPGPDDMDVLWALIQDSDTGDGLTELEILHNSIFMLNAGHDTTASSIANGIDLLFRFPDAHKRLIDDPALIRSAVEEMLRYESPLQIGNRRALEDVEIGGEKLPAGTFVHVVIASADRDERQFPNPDDFDVAREPNRHLAFGHGIHTCAGNSVARIEANIAFTKLLERFPNMRQIGETVRPHRTRFRIVESLQVELEPA